jgi:colanic acid biosynthesis glycosyl transferase WcaI
VVMYAGNVGRSQDLLPVIDAAATAGAELVIHGGGAGLDDLRLMVTGPAFEHVHFSGYVDRDQLGTVFASADLHVVPLKPGVAWASVPSKMLSIFSAGRPAVLAAEAESPAATVMREAGAGWTVEPGDAPALEAAIVAALADPAGLADAGRSAAAWAAINAGHDRMAEQWEQVLLDLVPRGEP